MKDLDELMTSLNGMTAMALGANIQSDVHRAAQDNARMLLRRKLEHPSTFGNFDDEIESCAKTGVALARAVAKECAPLLAPPRAVESPVPVEEELAATAITPEELERMFRETEDEQS